MNITLQRITKPTHGEQDWLDLRFWDDKKRKRVSASAVARHLRATPIRASRQIRSRTIRRRTTITDTTEPSDGTRQPS
jgi:hypothetical protein